MFTDPALFRKMVFYLENNWIKHWKKKDRKALKRTDDVQKWVNAYFLYKKEICMPYLNSAGEELELLLRLAKKWQASKNLKPFKPKIIIISNIQIKPPNGN